MMTDGAGAGPCPGCVALEAEVGRLGAELAAAQQDLDEAQQQLELYERAILNVGFLCQDIRNRARPILTRRGGVPRGFWSRVRGRDETAAAVLEQL